MLSAGRFLSAVGRNDMTTTQSSLVPAVLAPDLHSFAVRHAFAGFLAGY